MPIAIHTRALPATATLPGRIRAYVRRGGRVAYVTLARGSFDDDDHRAAAQALADIHWPGQPLIRCGETLDGRGDVFSIGAEA